MSKINFVKTSDSATAETLRKLNYQELPKEGKYFVFINKAPTNIQSAMFEQDKVIYTNSLAM